MYVEDSMVECQSKHCIQRNRVPLDTGLVPFYNETFPEEVMTSLQLCVPLLKNSTMVEGLRKREFLMIFGGLQSTLGNLLPSTVNYKITLGS